MATFCMEYRPGKDRMPLYVIKMMSLCDKKIELGRKFGNSDAMIRVTATQARRELKSNSAVESQALEGTFIHPGSEMQSKETEQRTQKYLSRGHTPPRVPRETGTTTPAFMASMTKALQTDPGCYCILLARSSSYQS